MCILPSRGVLIAKELKDASGPKLKDFRALLDQGTPQPIQDLKAEVTSAAFSATSVSVFNRRITNHGQDTVWCRQNLRQKSNERRGCCWALAHVAWMLAASARISRSKGCCRRVISSTAAVSVP